MGAFMCLSLYLPRLVNSKVVIANRVYCAVTAPVDAPILALLRLQARRALTRHEVGPELRVPCLQYVAAWLTS